MRLSEVPNFAHFLDTSPVKADSIWSRNLEDVSDENLTLYYARAKSSGVYAQALEAIDRLQSAIIIAAIKGELDIGSARVVLHQLPPPPYFVDEFVDALARLRPARRAAILFALEMDMEPGQVLNLTWDAAKRLQPTALAAELLRQAELNRHIALPYVWWEWASSRIATPLLELEWHAQQAFGCPWHETVVRYASMHMVNRREQAEHFLGLVERSVPESGIEPPSV